MLRHQLQVPYKTYSLLICNYLGCLDCSLLGPPYPPKYLQTIHLYVKYPSRSAMSLSVSSRLTTLPLETSTLATYLLFKNSGSADISVLISHSETTSKCPSRRIPISIDELSITAILLKLFSLGGVKSKKVERFNTVAIRP